LNKGVVDSAKSGAPLIGGAQGGPIRRQLQSRDITEGLLALSSRLTAGLKGR
jgi:hypothetical protein